MAHPTRVFLMSTLNGRVDSPTNLARALDRDIKHVTYHLSVLRELGCVELVSPHSTQGRRASQSRYTATRRPIFYDEAWQQLDDDAKQAITTTLMRLISAEVAEAMEAGTFFDPDDNHLSRTPFCADEEGWREITEVLDRTSGELLEVEERISDRLAKGASGEILTKVMMIQFRSPKPRSG